MLKAFGIALSLGLAMVPNLAASANSFDKKQEITVSANTAASKEKDKSPNRGTGRRELYINRAKVTIQ